MQVLLEKTLQLEKNIDQAWEEKESDISYAKDSILEVLELLDKGQVRVVKRKDGEWQVNQWIKKAVLLSFKINGSEVVTGGPGGATWYDKVPSKLENWTVKDFEDAEFRAVPGVIVRHSAFIDKGAVLMPSFINVGAYVGAGSMIDSWVTIGSCAQIGKNCHISEGCGIAGVLEPIQANPVIIEDNCFIGAKSSIAEGVVVEEGSVISMGVCISASTKIVDRETGEIFYGRVPKGSVVVSGSMPDKNGGPSIYAAVIVKKADKKTLDKTNLNDDLRK